MSNNVKKELGNGLFPNIGIIFICLLLIFVGAANCYGVKLTVKPSLNPFSTIDEDGNIYIVWEGYKGSEGVYYKYYNSSTDTWSSDILIANGYCRNPKIVINNGNIYVAWENNDTGNWKIYFEEIDKQGNNLTNLLYINSSDSLANLDFTLKDDVLHFVWEQNDSVYLNKHEIANSSLTPVILIDRLFRWMHIFWVEHEDGNTEIYYTYIAPVSHDTDGDGLYDSIEKGLTNFSSSTYNDADPSTTTNHSNVDSDGDGLPDGWIDGWCYNSSSNSWGVNYSRRDGIKQAWEGEDLNLNGKTEANETSPLNNDSDNDGLPDGWETWYGLDALNASGINGANGDLDGDGLPNIYEYGNGTSPVNNDSDGDGLSDRYEVEHGMNPLSKDGDNDGLKDGEENFLNDVDNDGLIPPLDNDSDNDGVVDGREYYLKLPNITVTPFDDTDNDSRINMFDSDLDNDGLSDGFEFGNGSKPWRPANYDSDGDGLSDGEEVNGFYVQVNGQWITVHTDPDSSDTDKDGLSDGYLEGGELIRRGSFPSYYYVAKSNPMLNDTDGDGLLDGIEVKGWTTYGNKLSISNPLVNDTDNDGISDYLEYVYNYDASSGDSDNDFLWDAQEDKNKNGLVDENETSPLDPDSDRDGYLDGDEYLNHTDPLNKDTDGDGLIDSLEQNLVTFRTNAVDYNNGSSMETSFSIGSYTGTHTFEIGCVASEITEVTANIRVQHSRLLSSDEYTWQQAPEPHSTGWVKVNFNITGDNYFVVDYYMFSNPTVELTQQCDTSNTQNGNCSVYDLGQIINVTYYYKEIENKTLEYVPSTYYYISFGKVHCTLPNGSTIVLNDTQYTYANYSMNRHIKNEIVTGHGFINGESGHITYICGPEIDYNSIGNFGTWIAVALTPVSDLLYAKRWNGDKVNDSDIHGSSVAHTPEGYQVYYNSTNNYLIIDVPGNENPVYNSPAPPTALIGRAPIYSYKSNKQESYTNIFNYDPGNRDTNNDGLLDSENRDILKLRYSNTGDKDNDNISDWIDRDCDNDGILNGEEAFWNKDTDGDDLLNAFDNDSDNDGKLDSEEVKVIFRASKNGTCNFISLPNVPWHVKYCYNSYSATSIALYNSSSDSLDEFLCDYILPYNSSNLSLSLVNYTFLGNPTPITTPEDYYIYRDNNNSSYVYIDIPDGYGDFSPSESLSEGTKLIRCSKVSGYISTNRSLDQSYALNHLETYDFTWALTAGSVDNDNDKLPTNGFGPDLNDSNPDIDGDGLKDGYERNWSGDTDGDGLININDVDSDNDGLPDGWVDGWCYNKTKALNHEHALGTIDGYGVWCSQDGVKQAWEGEDLNQNGRVDTGESDMLVADSDGDCLSDADEKIVYHTSPVSTDTDDDYLSDPEEIFNYYQMDKLFVPDYVNESDVEKFNNTWVAYYSYPLTLQIQIPYRGEYRISTSPAFANITISNDTFSSTGVFVTTLNANLTPGIYNLTTKVYNNIEYILIEKKSCNATNNDTDGDGIVDGLETGSPLDKDSDNDGLLDNEEQLVSVIDRFGHTWTSGYHSSPTKLDTDEDGISDRYDKRPYTYDSPEFSDLYPKNSIVVNRTFRGWGLDGISWIEHLYGTEYRGREDVKVSNMTNESKVRNMIKRVLPKDAVWGEDIYKIESIDVPSTFDYDPASTPSHDFEVTPIEGTPIFHIRYYFVHNDYEAMLVNDLDVYRSPEGKLCYCSENCPTKMKYLLFDIPVELNRDQYLIFAYSLDPEDDEYYYVNESNYSLPAFEYKIYYNTKNNQSFSSDKMHYSLIAEEGVSIAKPIERTPTRHAYSIRIPIKEDIATQEKLYLYLSPIYIVKPGGLEYKDSNGIKHIGDGLSEYDVKYLPMNTDSFKIGYIERVIPEYAYKAITKLNDNISYIDEILPSNLSDYATGSYIFGSYPNYRSVDIYNGEPENFNLYDSILQDDVIVIISKTEASVNKIISMINFTGEWYYNTTNQFNETIKSKQFKSITEVKSLHFYYSKLLQLSENLPTHSKINKEMNITLIKINPDQDEYNYTVTNTYTIETTAGVKKKHVISDLTNDIDDVGPSNQVFQEFKDNFKNEPSYSLLTTDWRGVAVIVPQNPEQTIFKTISCYFDIGSQVIGYGMTAYDTFDNIRDLTKIVKTTEEVSKAKLIKEFMGPGSPGVTDAIGFAITGIDLALTWANAYQAKDKFVTQAAMEHTAADIMDVGLSVAGMVYPPTFVVMPTWYATYYASKGIMYVFGIKEGEYFYKASPGFDSVVFAYEVFSGVTMPSDFAQDAFRDAEERIKCYVNNTCYINEKELPDSMLGNIKVSPYYPTFYIDPR